MFKQLVTGLQQQDPGPVLRKLARLLSCMLLALTALLLYAPALGDAKFVFGTDTVSHDYIMHFYGWAISIGQHGELPLWNPYLFSGLPMIGSAALCPFYPSQWLYFILPFNTAYTLQYIFALSIGGIGAAWWMRCLGHRRSICLWAGFAYMFSGHFLTLTYAGHLQKMIALGWVPVALGATFQILRLVRAGQNSPQVYRAVVILGLALGMQLLASHPQIFYATVGACFLQLSGMAFSSIPWGAIIPSAKPAPVRTPESSMVPFSQAVILTVLAVGVCMAVSAAQLFPVLDMSSMSNRADGVSFEEAVETSYPPLEFFEYAVPQIFGDSVRDSAMPYFGKWGERIVSDYLGLPILFLAIAGLFGSKRRYRWFLLALFIVGTLVGFGRYTPLYWLLYHSVPGFSSFRSPGTFMFLSNCALIGLAAFGLDYLLNLARSVNDKGWGSSFGASSDETSSSFSSALPSTANDTQPFPAGHLNESFGNETPPYMESIQAEEHGDDPGYVYSYSPPDGVTSSNFIWDNESTPWLGRPAILVFLAAVAVTALIGAVIALARNWEVDLKIATASERMGYHTYARVAGACIATMLLIMAVLLLRLRTWIGGVAIRVIALVFPLYHNYHFIQFEPLSRYMAHISRQADLTNLAKIAPQPIRLVEQNQLKNEAITHGVGTATGYHPVIPAAYAHALATLGAESDELGSLFAINYARTFSDDPLQEGSWQVLNPDEPARGGSKLWQRNKTIPYLRGMADVVKVDTDELDLTSASLRAIAMDAMAGGAGARSSEGNYVVRVSEYDARRYRLYDGHQMADGQLQRWTPHEIRIHTESTSLQKGQQALLPLSEPYSPGWQAETSKGKRLPLIAANGLQRAIVLPPGTHNIRLVYSPYSLRLGMFFSLLSATVLVSFGVGTLSRRFIKGRKNVLKAIKKSNTGRHPVIPGTNL